MKDLRIKVKYRKKTLKFTNVKSYFRDKQFLTITFDLDKGEVGQSRIEFKLTEVQSIEEIVS